MATTEESIDIPIKTQVTSGIIGMLTTQQVIAKTSGEMARVITLSGDYVSISGQVTLPSTQVVKISGEAVIIGDSTGRLATIDSTSNAFVTIDIEHYKAHEGGAFNASYFDPDTDEVSCTVLTVTVPVSGEYHFTFIVNADGAGRVEFKENILNSGGTTDLMVYDVNRSTRTSSLVTFKTGGNFLSGQGTSLWNGLIGANNNKTQIGGEARNGYEWVLTSGDFQVFFYPDADDKKCTINADFYEVS